MTATACGQPHPNPPHLAEVLPRAADDPSLTKALAAAWAQCAPCQEDHRDKVSTTDGDLLVLRALGLVLMWASVADYMADPAQPPAATADELVARVTTERWQSEAHTTTTFLSQIPLDSHAPPLYGGRSATFNPDLVLHELWGADDLTRGRLWSDSIRLLTIVLDAYATHPTRT